MKIQPGVIFLAAIAVISGLIVMLGAFLPLPILADLRSLLLDWAMILVAVATIVGVLHLARVHWRKLRQGPNAAGSAVTLAALTLTLVIFLIAGPAGSGTMWLYNNILVPIETSLMALLAVTLIVAFARMFTRRVSVFNLIFAGVVMFVLLTAFAWTGFDVFGLRDLRTWIVNVWAVAGARGILLGVALGAVATGIRVLIGADRPYSR